MTTLFNKRQIEDTLAQNKVNIQEISKFARNDNQEHLTSNFSENLQNVDNKLESSCIGKEEMSIESCIENTDEGFESIEKEPKHELHNILSYAIDDFHKICGEFFDVISQGLLESLERTDEINSIIEDCQAERIVTENRIEQATLQVSLFNSRILELTSGKVNNGENTKVSTFEDAIMAPIGNHKTKMIVTNDILDNNENDDKYYYYENSKNKENGKHVVTFKEVDSNEEIIHGDVGVRRNKEN